MIGLAERGVECCADDPERARAAFSRIERMGRDSLNAMRELLGVLRSDERGSRAPRPTLAEIEGLLDQARARGGLVDLELDGEQRPLPLGVELAAYRALQHALVAINGREPATVALRYLPDALELEIRGAATGGAWAQAAVAAARERIVAQGGSFSSDDSSPRLVLRAALPIELTHA
jgi:signal transduction histidine kinase